MKKLVLLSLLVPLSAYSKVEYTKQDAARVDAVKEFVTNALADARSKNNPSPLLGDGVNTLTKKPVQWIYPDERKAAISNFASQQNFLRVLNGLTVISGNEAYSKEAYKTTKYFLDNYTHKNGLFYWGGHRFVNLDTLELEGPQDKNQVHELKNHFPYYEFLHQVDSSKTEKYIKAFWNAHVEDWKTMDMGRHGRYSKSYRDNVFQRPLPKKDIVDPAKLPHLPVSKGLTFINAGSDLIYSAYLLADLADDNVAQGATDWARFLMRQYKLASHPQTGAPVYQFTSPRRREAPRVDKDTNSKYGDRATRQFAAEYGDIAREGNVLFKGNEYSIVVSNALVELQIAEKTQDEEILRWAVDSLKGYYNIAYDMQSGLIKPVFNDGTNVSGKPLARDGYYGPKGRVFTPKPIRDEKYLLPVVHAYRLSGDAQLAELVRSMTRHLDWGDIGTMQDNSQPNLNMNTKNSAPAAVFAALEMYQATGQKAYLNFARVIGNNIVEQRFVRGYFMPDSQRLNARIDALEPLALVALDAALKGKQTAVASFISEGGYIHGEFLGNSNTYDRREIYNQNI